MSNLIKMFRFSDFELDFLAKRNIAMEGNELVNLNTGVPFQFVNIRKDKENEKVDRYIFKSNSVTIECERVNGNPTAPVTIFVKKKRETYYASEYYYCSVNCGMQKFGCECDLDDAYKATIFGIYIKDYPNAKLYHGYVTVEPRNNPELTSRTTITKYINDRSTISPHIIDSTKYEILDDTLHCHSASECEPTRYIACGAIFEDVLTKAIEEEFCYEPKIQNYFKDYVPELVETYTISLDYTRKIDRENTKQKK